MLLLVTSIYWILLMSVDTEAKNSSLPIVGIWIPFKSRYIRSAKFLSNKPGYDFKSDGQLVRRGNIGWCATPPIRYRNFDGHWKWINETVLTINTRYWGGYYTQKLRYQFVTNDKNEANFEWYN